MGCLLLALWLIGAAPVADVAHLSLHRQLPPETAGKSLFAFRAGFWVNLHHFLYVLGRARNGSPDSRRDAVVKAPADLEGLSVRPEDERTLWDEVVHFYSGELARRDAVFDDSLVATTRKLADAGDATDVTALGLDRQLAATLKLAAPVYRAVWWPRHSRANEARIKEFQKLADTHGAVLVKRLTSLYGTQWPAQPRIIDVAAYSNWAGAYSTDGGLIVVSSTDGATAGWLGLETLLHESSHQWDDEVQRRLAAIAAKQGKPLPSGLSHALIFYTSGELVAEVVPGHVPYAVKFGLWNRQGLAVFKPLLDRYWRPYIRGSGTFEEAAAKLVEGR